ncbi:odorant receptor 43a isoform X2 [Andrena cerasifolii]|uniref:odorant receptor 43a isoform X2 n=1 Tax=Andrena cerasifolii TaxID=2819439 RepID=UPI0040377517
MTTDTGIPAGYRNIHYKSDTKYTLNVAKTLLTPVGIWPLQRSDSSLDRVKRFVQIVTVFALMCFLLIPHVIYTFHDCEDLTRYMKVIAAQVFSFLGIIKFWAMIVNRQEMRCCLVEIEAHFRDVECEEDRLVMKKSAKIGTVFTTVYLGLTYCGALPYHLILPLLSDRIVKSDNTTQIPLPYLSNYVFFVIEDSPLHEITFATQMMISCIILSTNCGTYLLIASLAIHSCGLFEVVNKKIESIFELSQDELQECLNRVVQHHVKAIKFAEMIEEALSVVFLLEIVCCTIIVCFLIFGVILEWADNRPLSTITYFVLMTSIFINVFIISFIGDRLKHESEKVGETSYFVPWYDLPEDMARNIRMIMLRTRRPTCLTAGKLFGLSLQGFCDFCKTSAAYLNFLQTLTA